MLLIFLMKIIIIYLDFIRSKVIQIFETWENQRCDALS